MLYLTLIYSLVVIILTYSFKTKKLFSNYTGDRHQLFSNKKNIPLVGGIFLLVPIILINYQNLNYNILVILVFLIGFFSDRKILISPKKRFFFQVTLVSFSVILLDLEIVSSRLTLFDTLLQNSTFNIIFTSFCLLILVNGSNFIDGLNGLLLFYMTFVIFILLKIDFLYDLKINQNFIVYLIVFMSIMIFLNLSNFLMLGDAGAYVLSFIVGYLIIKCHYSNPYVSPYFFITLIWYPCFENLFSIIRKLKSKFSPFTPDNNHLHQLFLQFSLKKKIIKNKLAANNISSIIISLFNFLIIFISSLNPYSSIYQIKLIIFSISIYLLLFSFLKKNLNKNQV
tara:strand:- start:402 stop:1421 length:1020 start_codon:yes stop_codon:yes gene_type:complete